MEESSNDGSLGLLLKALESSARGSSTRFEQGSRNNAECTQKVVVKLSMIDAKKRSKAMRCAAGFLGNSLTSSIPLTFGS
ncbi:hypothetical protein MA16_Dca024529 [Dendrobium catenatum]|uniref:Uncharacterized protein n=1 Tax=Dendrobium catenatum TaxID=906689 RepID=A0A2I0W213_9ASPA|nr:hypothetical protein MA16_Dca024529 [Dendrobium catenatum]